MASEREAIRQHVIPPLATLCQEAGKVLELVDPWESIPEGATPDTDELARRLDAIEQCAPLFVSLFGERYGFPPGDHAAEVLERHPWVRSCKDASLFELEIRQALLKDPVLATRALCYFRDADFVADLKLEKQLSYSAESIDAAGSLAALKGRIREGGFGVWENYPCTWDEEAGRLGGLEAFSERLFQDLWSAFRAEFPEEFSNVDHSLGGLPEFGPAGAGVSAEAAEGKEESSFEGFSELLGEDEGQGSQPQQDDRDTQLTAPKAPDGPSPPEKQSASSEGALETFGGLTHSLDSAHDDDDEPDLPPLSDFSFEAEESEAEAKSDEKPKEPTPLSLFESGIGLGENEDRPPSQTDARDTVLPPLPSATGGEGDEDWGLVEDEPDEAPPSVPLNVFDTPVSGHDDASAPTLQAPPPPSAGTPGRETPPPGFVPKEAVPLFGAGSSGAGPGESVADGLVEVPLFDAEGLVSNGQALSPVRGASGQAPVFQGGFEPDSSATTQPTEPGESPEWPATLDAPVSSHAAETVLQASPAAFEEGEGRKGKAVLLLTVLVVVAALGGAGYWAVTQLSVPGAPTAPPSQAVAPVDAPSPPAQQTVSAPVDSTVTSPENAPKEPADEVATVVEVAGKPALKLTPPPARTLVFPENVVLGDLFVREFGDRGIRTWEHLGAARGTVQVPAGKDIRLSVDLINLTLLSGFKPDDFHTISLRGLRIVDGQLELLKRFTGLGLVNLTYTMVTETGAEDLEKALPGCIVLR